MRIAYLGPAGTFTEDALGEAIPGSDYEPLRTPTIPDAILAVERGEAERALVPIENSLEGSVRPTLDTLAFDVSGVTIVGEHDYRVRVHLIAREGVAIENVEAVLSHPQPLAQCARFLREQLPGTELRSVSSTAAAVRMVSESARPWAALGARAAAELYGCELLLEGVEDQDDNVTRFVWIAPQGAEVPAGQSAGAWKTSLVFSELGADHPGALVDALSEFSSRGINLTRIESRPLRQGLGRYMFFCDLEGKEGDPAVAEAIEELQKKAESTQILGSYPVG
ncbi:MAG TPA: prephenate dehydratase [Solirubrobacterales bacterium]|jgi:prephenate dehydratase|nr:prephenate dehydratase [Solirubrobacterales bacterium]